MKRFSLILILAALFAAGCSGGGGGGGDSSISSNTANTITDTSVCSVTNQKTWIRAHLNDVYLWYDQIVDVDPTAYATPADYFYALLVRSQDRFSFTESQASIDAFFQSGTDVGYGASFVNDRGHLRVSYTDPGTPAVQSGNDLTRGVEITQINGTNVDLSVGLTQAQLDALYPTAPNVAANFTVKDVGAATTRPLTIVSQSITTTPVQNVQVIQASDGKNVGYLQFNDHIATAESELIDAMNTFRNYPGGIDDLVIDIRYNGGGFLYVADELASMIGGAAVQGHVFEKLIFNAKHTDETNDPNNTTHFLTTSYSDSSQALPQLNLHRVFVLTGPNTCSASEAIINGLSPFVSVIRIGGTTCGKPYGMIETDNCDQAYFAIQFKGVNDLGQGDYTSGFAPTCSGSDDLDHPLGDPNENLFGGALSYRISGSCPALSFTQSTSAKYAPLSVIDMRNAPWRKNLIVR